MGRVLRPDAEQTPDRSEFEYPQEVGITLDVLARIEDQTVTLEQIAGVAKTDEGIVGYEPRDAGQPTQEHQPRDKGQRNCNVDRLRSSPEPAFAAHRATASRDGALAQVRAE